MLENVAADCLAVYETCSGDVQRYRGGAPTDKRRGFLFALSAIDPAERVITGDSGAKVRLYVRRLPDIFDIIAVLSDDERLQVLVNVGGDCEGPLRMRRAADAVETLDAEGLEEAQAKYN